jgi:hypothetical protein
VVRHNQRKVIGEGVRDNRIYELHYNTKLNTTKNIEHVTIFQETSNIDLWHQRFRHLNANSLKILLKKKLIEGLSINNKVELSFCNSCVQRK